MDTDDTKTRKALISAANDFLTVAENMNTRFGNISGLPTIGDDCIAWENRKFETGNKQLWTSVFYRPNQPTGRTVGNCGIDDITGFLQIDFNIPPDVGEQSLIEWEKKARLYFFAGRGLSFDGHIVLVTSSGMSQGRHVENNFRKSLTVAFRANVRRNNQI